MQFQKVRDPERVEIERRAAFLAEAGYPTQVHDRALDAEAIIKAVKLARAAQSANSKS
ncbi:MULTISPECIES: hypothetical protein [Pseudomonas]|uniref:Uncharacterized protein n=1 Tax=Pseudomonas kurunegalensis TaxID=485880 RepID=A0ACC5UP03_9PSED|nr:MULTISPECIES: hypothetical protein [Pseudomonas]MBV4516166.1 hypothetical protein [Pseudomonas kurunegalensis]